MNVINLTIRRALWLLLAILALPVAAQEAVFDLNDTLADSLGTTELSALVQISSGELLNSGTTFQQYTFEPVFETDTDESFISLASEQYLGVAPELTRNFQALQVAQIDLRFRFRDHEATQEDGYFRQVLGTTSGDQRDIGFQVWVQHIHDRYELVIHIGDNQRSGYRYVLDVVPLDTWTDLTLIFRLTALKPRIDAIINNKPFTLWLTNPEQLDVADLVEHLNGGIGYAPSIGGETVSLFVGGFYYDRHPLVEMPLDIGFLRIQSPKQPADAVALKAILKDLTDHVLGTRVLDEEELDERLGTFLIEFDDDWDELETEALAFLEAFESVNDPLFNDNGPISPNELSQEALLVFFLQKWVFENLFTPDQVERVAGLKFEAADAYPGIVDESAPRETASIEIDGSYSTDPGFLLNGQETVIRPTGFYAAPGELVTIKVDQTVIGAGLEARIGIHRFDLSESWAVYNRFPRISNVFPLTEETTLLANPFGGGIYIEVPDGTDLGRLDLTIEGAVKMPMYSTLELIGHSQDKVRFAEEIANWPVPWFELHTSNLSATLPMNLAHLFNDPEVLLDHWNAALDQVNRLSGRPLERFRSEWYATDRQIPVFGTALPASYPTYPAMDIAAPGVEFENDPNSYSLLTPLQSEFASGGAEFDRYRDGLRILWHEWGHLHNLPTLGYNEQESNVNILAVIVYNELLGMDLETAMRLSGFQRYGWDASALDVMFSPNWQTGTRLSFDGWDNELRYQTRSWARLVEIVRMLGWDALGAIHRAYYERGLNDGVIYNYDLSDDDFIETASQVLGVNLGPVFEFWGVPPSAELYERLREFPVPSEFSDRLGYYRTLIPGDNEAFIPIYETLTATTGAPLRWDYFLEEFDEETAALIHSRLNFIECRYYGCEAPVADAGANLVAADDAIPGVDVQLDASGSTDDYGISSYVWSCANGSALSGVRPTLENLLVSTTCTLSVSDYAGLSDSDTVSIIYEPANGSPEVLILGGNRMLEDSDGFAGEIITVSATATDRDGKVVSAEWVVNNNVIATGLTADITLADGQTLVTFRAVDDDGATASDTATITVESPPLEEGWPAPYSGVTPDRSLGLEFNNISLLSPRDGLIYSCLRVLSNGEQSDLSGIQKFDIAFQLVSPIEATIGVVRIKPFNGTRALNEYGEFPDCSGAIEMSTGKYKDIIQVGSDVFSVVFELFDPVNLLFRLVELE